MTTQEISPERISRGDVVGCFIVWQDRFLVLYRSKDSPRPCMWGLPAGKVEQGESFATAMQREIMEETGLQASLDQLKPVKSDFVANGERSFMFHMFCWELHEEPKIELDSHAHTDYRWVTVPEALNMYDLIPGLHEHIQLWQSLAT